MEIPALLSRLWELAGANPLDDCADWNSAFDRVGLILLAPPRHGGYWCTPQNSIAFATTGGDGVHYSWVILPGTPIDCSPIVMTVPMSDTPNVIVGANLREFLCLGCRFGYFALEQLVYDFDRTVSALENGELDAEATNQERNLLNRLSTALDLNPWEDPLARLKSLRERYLPLLRIAESPDVV